MSSNLVVARRMVEQARELVASERLVTIRLGDVLVQAQATQKTDEEGNALGVELKLMADTPLGPIGGTLYAPQETFENMLEAAAISDVLPRTKALVDRVREQPPRFLLNR
jgi:hypothetical protein